MTRMLACKDRQRNPTERESEMTEQQRSTIEQKVTETILGAVAPFCEQLVKLVEEQVGTPDNAPALEELVEAVKSALSEVEEARSAVESLESEVEEIRSNASYLSTSAAENAIETAEGALDELLSNLRA